MRDLIARQQVLMLATHQADGSAHVVPVMYLFEDGRFLVATSSQSRKARNVAVRSQVTVTIEDREATAWVSALGTPGCSADRSRARLTTVWTSCG
jgi:general stress protein 26